jgi:hypothetical protein
MKIKWEPEQPDIGSSYCRTLTRPRKLLDC